MIECDGGESDGRECDRRERQQACTDDRCDKYANALEIALVLQVVQR